MRGRALGRRARRVGRSISSAPDAVLSSRAGMRPGAVIGCCVSLVVAGVLLARGFVGVVPGRPVELLMGGLLAGTALLSLVIDHVAVRVRTERPDHVLVTELDRCRRYGHPLTLAEVRTDEVAALRIVSRLRTPDRAWRVGATLVVLLAETDGAGGLRFVDRLSDLVGANEVRLASFPEDAVTADGLYAALAPPPAEPTSRPVADGEALIDRVPTP